MTNGLTIYKGLDEVQIAQLSWSDIVNEIIDTIPPEEELPDKVVRATELLVSNWPVNDVAKKIGVTSRTVKNWIAKYPIIPSLMENSRAALVTWRLARLQQQLGMALDVSEEILTARSVPALDRDGHVILNDKGEVQMIEPNAKLLGVKAQQARYVMGLFLGDSNSNLNVNINIKNDQDKVLRAHQDALQYIASEMSRLDSVEGHFVDSTDAPIVNADGEPFFGKMGELDLNKEGYLCHICGGRFENLAVHVRSIHNIEAQIYEIEFNLEEGALG